MEKELEKLKKELEESKKQAEEYLNGWKRAKADYENLKKETAKEKGEWVKFLNSALILEMLAIYENFKRAIEQFPKKSEESWLEGIKQIKKQFEDFLKSQGVAEIKTVGEKFNPDLHEAVDKRKEEGKEPGIILEESHGGYLLHGKVIKAAKVIISE